MPIRDIEPPILSIDARVRGNDNSGQMPNLRYARPWRFYIYLLQAHGVVLLGEGLSKGKAITNRDGFWRLRRDSCY